MPPDNPTKSKCLYFWRRKGLWLEDEIPDCLLTRWRAWLYDLLKISQVAIERCVKPFESSDNALCQIHHFCDASQEACRPLLGQVYFLFFYWQVLPGSFLQENNHPYIRVNGWYFVSSTEKILTKKLELPIDRFPFWMECMTVIRYIANESKRFRHVCCQPYRRKNLTHLIGSA